MTLYVIIFVRNVFRFN